MPRMTDLNTGLAVDLRSHRGDHDHTHATAHEHDDGHDHHHADHVHVDGKTIVLQEAVLAKNDRLAERNRQADRAGIC